MLSIYTIVLQGTLKPAKHVNNYIRSTCEDIGSSPIRSTWDSSSTVEQNPVKVKVVGSKPAYPAMETKVKFFKQDNRWYADIPNHTLEENEMVMGADIALDYLSDGKNEVILTLTDEYPGWNTPLEFFRKEHDDEGATYSVSGILLMGLLEEVGKQFVGRPEVWICNVTHDVFGEHPEKIYLLKVE